MAQIEKNFVSNRGLDLKSSDLTRSSNFASSMLNAQYRKSGAIEKRRGWQAHSGETEAFGAFKYTRVDEDDQLEEILISVGRNVTRCYFTEITVSYSGSEASAFLSFFFDPDTDQYRCTITAGLVEVLNFAVGVGVDESSPITVQDLADEINATADLTAAVTGDATVPAAFLKIVRDVDVKASSWVGRAAYWVQVNQSLSNPFDGSYTRRADTDFENVSGAVLNNVLYLSNGYDWLYKYDGQTLYRAGLPKAASIAAVDSGAGSISGNNYVWRVQYVQYDAAGNIIEGNILSSTLISSLASKKVDVTVANILAAEGFNTGAAIVAGAQVTVNTITVDNGSGGQHTLKIGDTAYFYDGVSASYVEREVTAISLTTITVAGAAVTVADNAVISNNLRISIQRNKTSGTTPTVFYSVVEIPNNPFASTQVYVDDLPDASLGFLIVPPATDRSLPPKGKYICSFQKLLFVTGNLTDQTLVYWSDIDSPEYFPNGLNQDRLENTAGETPRAIGQCGTVLAVLTPTTTHRGSGTFADNNYRFEEIAGSIGCSSHASLAQVEGVLAWWSDNGPYKMDPGSKPTPIGTAVDSEGRELNESRISPVMDQAGYESNPAYEESFFRARRVVGVNLAREKKVLFYVPAETVQSGSRIPNANTRIYAYDYTRDAWLEWSNLNMIGGAVVIGDEFYFLSRRLSGGDVISDLQRLHNLNDAWDYEDNIEPIDWNYGPQWSFLGEPGILKKYNEIQLYSLEDVPNNSLEVMVKQEINFQRGGTVAEFPIEITGSGYGQSAYGVDPYGDPINPRLKHELYRGRVTSTRTVFANNEHQKNCIISGWEFSVEAPYRKEFKK